MNIQLVEGLADAIRALSPEERRLLEEKLGVRSHWQETLAELRQHKAEIHADRAGQTFEPSIEETIQQMRDERTEQLVQSSFTDSEAN
mgnify:CR=1 FL=1